jgi:hypothetical protein
VDGFDLPGGPGVIAELAGQDTGTVGADRELDDRGDAARYWDAVGVGVGADGGAGPGVADLCDRGEECGSAGDGEAGGVQAREASVGPVFDGR